MPATFKRLCSQIANWKNGYMLEEPPKWKRTRLAEKSRFFLTPSSSMAVKSEDPLDFG